jgi:hypothetical protein
MIDKSQAVMAGLDPAIHESAIARKDPYRRRRAFPWMPATSAGMTKEFVAMGAI